MNIKELKLICYPESKRTTNDYIFFTLIFRRISIYFSYFLIKAKISANYITIIGIFAYIVGCYFLTKGTFYSAIWGAAVINFGMFLDLIDGEIARFNGPTKLGGFLDLQHSYLINAMLLPSIAIGLYNVSGNKSIDILLLSFAGTIGLCLFGTLFEIVKRHFKSRPDVFSQSSPTIGRIIAYQFNNGQWGISKLGRFLYLARMNILTTTGVMLPLLLVCTLSRTLLWYVIFYSIAFIGLYLTSVILMVIMLRLKRVRFE